MLLHMENNMGAFQVIRNGQKMDAQVGILVMMSKNYLIKKMSTIPLLNVVPK